MIPRLGSTRHTKCATNVEKATKYHPKKKEIKNRKSIKQLMCAFTSSKRTSWKEYSKRACEMWKNVNGECGALKREKNCIKLAWVWVFKHTNMSCTQTHSHIVNGMTKRKKNCRNSLKLIRFALAIEWCVFFPNIVSTEPCLELKIAIDYLSHYHCFVTKQSRRCSRKKYVISRKKLRSHESNNFNHIAWKLIREKGIRLLFFFRSNKKLDELISYKNRKVDTCLKWIGRKWKMLQFKYIRILL